MSQVLGFGASLLILVLYFLGTLGLTVSVVLILNKFFPQQQDSLTSS